MGQKVHPKGLRLGIVTKWDSNWYSEREYVDNLLEDIKIRNIIEAWDFRSGKGGVAVNF